MKLIAPIVSLLLPTCAFATITGVTYNGVYDNKDFSLNNVACSVPLYEKFHTFGNTPNFPGIGGSDVVKGYKSPGCGTCWNVTYPPIEVSKRGPRCTIQLYIVDSAGKGVVMSREAMDKLTGGKAVDLGHVQADFEQVSGELCGVRD